GTGKRRGRVQCTEAPNVGWNGAGCGSKRLRRLRNEGEPGGCRKLRLQAFARPRKYWIPCGRLAGYEAGRTLGALEYEIAGEILSDFRRNFSGRARNAIDDGIRKARERHGRGIDHVLLRLPLGRDHLRQSSGRRQKQVTRGSFHRTAVEKDRECSFMLCD